MRPLPARPATCLVGLVLVVGLLAGCAPSERRGAASTREPAVPPTARLHALLVNGGGKPAINYRSHLEHVRQVLALLETHGVPRERITIFSSDGSATDADLAIRDRETEPYAWLVPSSLTGTLRPMQYVSSEVDGMTLRPARRAALEEWFAAEGQALGPGDTLLLYVTDHGRKNVKDLANNSISLWHEELDVTGLRAMLATLDPGVRVVALMSQCYAGAFARLILDDEGGVSRRADVCGYFAATAKRPAYGCYPENLGKDGVGHSFRFLRALESVGTFPEANRRVQITDRTPDVPHRSSDFFLRRLLRHAAREAGEDVTPFTDALLARAWRDRGAWEPEIRLLDRVGHAFGSFSPRSLAELEAQAKQLPAFSAQLKTYAKRWREAFDELKRENLQRFLETHPEWKERLEAKRLADLEPAGSRELLAALLAELVPYSRQQPERWARLEALETKAEEASAARYRAEVRIGAVSRMRMLLANVAGRQLLAERDDSEAARDLARITACEDLVLDATPAVASAAALEPPEAYPPLREEQRLVARVTPAWMGIRYRPLKDDEHARLGTQVGAVKVLTVYEEHPAATALRVGDVVVGPPGTPFEEPNQLREWTMRQEIGAPARLVIRRDERPLEVALRLAPFPLQLPALPGPPEIGSPAPGLDVELFRGARALAGGKPRLLFFWATWCAICKTALPEVMAFGRERDVEVVAITDEDGPLLRKFFGSFDEPFPELVAIDEDRQTFLAYGVSGMPTFVLVDAAGRVQHYQAGYRATTGLRIDDWKWAGERRRAEAPAPAHGSE